MSVEKESYRARAQVMFSIAYFFISEIEFRGICRDFGEKLVHFVRDGMTAFLWMYVRKLSQVDQVSSHFFTQ